MITAETVKGIVSFQANGLPVVSLYCRVDHGANQREVRARVDSLLDQIRPLAKDRDLDHRYRLSVRADIEHIKDALGSERWPPGTIAIFSCSGRDFYQEIPLPRRVREQVMVDATPLARPMPAVLGEYCRACVLVLDRDRLGQANRLGGLFEIDRQNGARDGDRRALVEFDQHLGGGGEVLIHLDSLA